jgi:hypothetical protein
VMASPAAASRRSLFCFRTRVSIPRVGSEGIVEGVCARSCESWLFSTTRLHQVSEKLFRFAKREANHRQRTLPSAQMASAAASAARPGVAYTLGRTLYLSLTNRSNAAGILKTRGPGFVMPSTSLFVPFPKGAAEPTAVELAAVVDACYQHGDIVGMGENDPGVVFAGAGEPLLRLDVLVDTMDLVRESRHGALFRVHSNGLHPTTTARALADAKVDRVTVALATADPRQFHALVKPSGNEHNDFSTVCGFIASLAEFGVDVEAVTVAAPNVDVAAARKLSEALGASSHRTREYFP